MTNEKASQLFNEAILLSRANNYQQAIKLCETIEACVENNTELLNLKSLCLLKLGQYSRASELLGNLVKENPEKWEIKANLGRSLFKEKSYKNAISVLLPVIKLQPDYKPALKTLISCYIANSNYEAARKHLYHYLKIEKTNRYAYMTLAKVDMLLCDWEEATKCFEQLLLLNPTDKQSCLGLAQCNKELGRYNAAMSLLLDFYDNYDSNDSSLVVNACHLAVLNYDIPLAESLLDKVKGTDEFSAEGLNLRAHIADIKGNPSQSIDICYDILKRYPNDYKAIFRLYRNDVNVLADNEAAVKALVQEKSNPKLSHLDKCTLGFLLAKHFESTGNIKLAFENYTWGNKEQKEYFEQRGKRHLSRKLDSSLKLLKQGNESIIPNINPLVTQSSPIFITGLPRSGSTLIEQVLSNHSDIAAGGEIQDLQSALCKYRSGDIDTSTFKSQLVNYREKLDALADGAKHVTDKLPGNYENIAAIRHIFPDAKIIVCKRNPLAIAWSMYTNIFTSDHLYSNDFESIRDEIVWFMSVLTWHEQNLSKQDFTQISYEDVISNTTDSIRGLCKFLQLPFQSQMLAPQTNKRYVHTLSLHQVRRPIYDSSLYSYKRYAKLIEKTAPQLSAMGQEWKN